MKKWLAGLLLGVYLTIGAVAYAEPKIPPAPSSSIYVQDYAGVLSPETKNRINDVSGKLAAKTKAQIVVVTVKTLEGTPIEEYGLEILRKWGIGDKALNNGLLMLVAVDDRQSRIEVGYGLEGALPDAKTGQIQDQYMLPYFREGNYDKGVLNGYLTLVTATAKEYNLEFKTDAKPYTKVQSQTAGGPSWWDTAPWWLKLIIISGALLLFVIDFTFFGGTITYFLLSLLRSRGGGGGGGGGYGGGSGGGGGSSRRW